jgi:aminoglycoside phosphotransferase family enzyme
MPEDAILPQAAPRSSATVDLDAKVTYLHTLLGPGDEAIETHFAWVFLTGPRALKLRKPVRRDSMDYSTIAARRHDSEEEVRLNRRLASHVYLGTLALTHETSGRLTIGGTGETVDWLVEMRRLDRARMLDALLARGAAPVEALARIIDLLAAFYAREPAAITDGATLDARLRHQVAANHRALQTLEPEASAALRNAQLAFLDGHRALIDSRAAGGCIVEAHGDLRPEHILVNDPPAVIDCLEFDRNLRVLDRAEELAFLELECNRLGHGMQGLWLLKECLGRLDDRITAPMLQFYRSHRAATRGKLYAWRSLEADGGSPDDWRARARSYLADALEDARLAARH